ncbi:hypothetical protein AV530_015398 [Patagioenas fasciata monilis]|uniref:Uncharacterized protein n=1 Tax=Patagioenas fasciata monilis TaxID=372326 RepID=A0A1V4JV67_PATFA|nr:hypothetical protein AV530_015398 [Patagioenas fasciata monilis]
MAQASWSHHTTPGAHRGHTGPLPGRREGNYSVCPSEKSFLEIQIITSMEKRSSNVIKHKCKTSATNNPDSSRPED